MKEKWKKLMEKYGRRCYLYMAGALVLLAIAAMGIGFLAGGGEIPVQGTVTGYKESDGETSSKTTSSSQPSSDKQESTGESTSSKLTEMPAPSPSTVIEPTPTPEPTPAPEPAPEPAPTPMPEPAPTPEPTPPTPQSTYERDRAEQVVIKMNAHRAANGLPALTVDNTLLTIADRRAVEIVSDFSHNGAVTAGENIAYASGGGGYADNYDFFEAWKNSPGHNANMLREGFVTCAVSIYREGDSAYAVTVFGR